MDIVANKHKGIYASNCFTKKQCQYFRQNNNGNVLCLGVDFVTIPTAIEICLTFINTEFLSLNQNRIDLLQSIERGLC